jgi:hypothetical protein
MIAVILVVFTALSAVWACAWSVREGIRQRRDATAVPTPDPSPPPSEQPEMSPLYAGPDPSSPECTWSSLDELQVARYLNAQAAG